MAPLNASAPHVVPRSAGVGQALIRAVPLLWMGVLCLLPLLLTLRIALSRAAQAQPPYEPHFIGIASWREFVSALSFDNFVVLANDDLYVAAILSSVRIAATASLITLVIAYPLAYTIARARKRQQNLFLMLVLLPFWTSFLIRIYAWLVILKPEGLLNAALLNLGLIDAPLDLLNREEAVILGIVYAYLPFMVLPLYATLERLDDRLVEAARDLGAPPWKAFLLITVPLSWPGIVAGLTLVLVPAIGEFVIPDLLGGPDTLMIGRILWLEFFSNRDWPLASALALILLSLALLPLLVTERWKREEKQ